MGHLTSDELVDLAEGTRPEASAPHLQTCVACQQQLAGLRALMTAASKVDVPEPSPLFWDHLSARVREAVAAEGVPPSASWFRRFALPLSAAACAAIVIIGVMTLRPGRGVHLLGGGSIVPVADAAPDLDPLPDDPSLDLVVDLAAQAGWDGETAPSLEMHDDVAARAVAQLTPAERRELQRLLNEELARAGA